TANIANSTGNPLIKILCWGWWKMNNKQTILITGGAGFIGANFITYFAKKYPHYQLVNLDKLTYAGLRSNLDEVENLPNYQFIHGDIADEQLVHDIFSDYPITGVIHFAAESHVDRSIQDAKSFVATNVLGTFTLLKLLKTPGKNKDDLQKTDFIRFLQMKCTDPSVVTECLQKKHHITRGTRIAHQKLQPTCL